MFVCMSGFRIQLRQLSQLSTNRVIALETYIPLRSEKNVYFSKKDKYLKLVNIPFGMPVEYKLYRCCQQIPYVRVVCLCVSVCNKIPCKGEMDFLQD